MAAVSHMILLDEFPWMILIKMSLKIVPNGLIDNNPALVTRSLDVLILICCYVSSWRLLNQFSCSLIFIIDKTLLFHFAYIFNWCQFSCGDTCQIQNNESDLRGSFTKSEISITEKLTNGTALTQPWIPDDGKVIAHWKQYQLFPNSS